jgi:hypothetical protein
LILKARGRPLCKPTGAKRPAKITGKPASSIVLEDRR